MKRIAAAILRRNDKILICRRGPGGSCGYLWEFPGGKMEPGETPEECIVREIKEELNVDIVPEALLTTVECDYPAFHLTMHCFWSAIAANEQVELLEHEAAKWLLPEELDAIQWLPADLEVVDCLKKRLNPQGTALE